MQVRGSTITFSFARVHCSKDIFNQVTFKHSKEDSKALLDLLKTCSKVQFDGLSDKEIKGHLGDIFLFLIEHRTLGYIENFLCDLKYESERYKTQANKSLLDFCIQVAQFFLAHTAYPEVVKFSIAVLGLKTLDEDDMATLRTFGMLEDFALFVAKVFAQHGKNNILFELAKNSKGWGRIGYFKYLEVDSSEIREWLIFEGYKCEAGIKHAVIYCLNNGKLPEYIQENGWSDRLYSAVGAMIHALCKATSPNFNSYPHSSTLVALFIQESLNQKMNIARFAILCDLSKSIQTMLQYDECQKDELLNIINTIAFQSKIDWEGLVKIDVLSSGAVSVARYLGIDVWEELFEAASAKKDFKKWHLLTLSKNEEQYRRLCDLFEQRFELKSFNLESSHRNRYDESQNEKYATMYNNVRHIVRNLNQFHAVFGVELVRTLLKSPKMRDCHIALDIVESYKEFPLGIIITIQHNIEIERNKHILKRYEKILEADKEAKRKKSEELQKRRMPCGNHKCDHTWHLRVETGACGGRIHKLLENGEKEFVNLGYDILQLPQELTLRLQQWQALFDQYGIYWYQNDLDPFLKSLYALFCEQAIELAKELKLHFGYNAYVEVLVDGEMREIRRCVVCNDDLGIWEEDGFHYSLEGIMKYDFNLDISDKENEINQFDSELSIWVRDYWKFLGDDNDTETTLEREREFAEQGRILAQRARELLPKYCVVQYVYEFLSC